MADMSYHIRLWSATEVNTRRVDYLPAHRPYWATTLLLPSSTTPAPLPWVPGVSLVAHTLGRIIGNHHPSKTIHRLQEQETQGADDCGLWVVISAHTKTIHHPPPPSPPSAPLRPLSTDI